MVKYIDKNNTYIDDAVEIGEGSIIYPNVMLEGNTKIGNNCVIHMGCYIKDSVIDDDTIVYHSHIEESRIGKKCKIGPYTHIRSGNVVHDAVKIGAFVELKKSTIEENTKIPHLSYIGDAMIGKNVNIGCGVVTANFDGRNKYQTIIEDNVFAGCNVNLIAPIRIQKNTFIAAGSTISKDLPSNSFAIERANPVIKTYQEDV